MDITKFWKRVCDEIKARKISRKKFAESVDIPYNTFKSWLYYNRSIEVGTAYDIAVALGVSLEYLINGYGRKKNAGNSRIPGISVTVTP